MRAPEDVRARRLNSSTSDDNLQSPHRNGVVSTVVSRTIRFAGVPFPAPDQAVNGGVNMYPITLEYRADNSVCAGAVVPPARQILGAL